MDIERVLAGSELFAPLDEEGRRALAGIATEQPMEAGDVILAEGDPGSCFFVIARGEVVVVAETFGSEKEVARLGPGALFGEIAALTGEPRTATVRAATAGELARFEADATLEALKAHPRVLGRINRLGVQRSESTLSQVLDAD